jgi:hypothetical protein
VKTVLTMLCEIMRNYLVQGESVENHDEHLTFHAADGKTYKIVVEEVSE